MTQKTWLVKKHAMAVRFIALLLVLLNLVVYSTSITFNIERDSSNNDIIPNDFTYSRGQWLKTSCRNSCGTRYWNTDSQVSGCRCKCKYSHSTFVMNSTPEKSGCIKNEDIRSKSGCNMYFENFGNSANQVAVLPDGGLRFRGTHPFKCQIDGRPQYWDRGQWITAADDLFEFSGQSFEWVYSAPKSRYSGRIVRQYITNCKWAADSCIVFKVGGTLTYDVTPPTTQPVTTSPLPITTPATTTTTTKAPTTLKTSSSSTFSSSTSLPTSSSPTIPDTQPSTTKLTKPATSPTEHTVSPTSEITSQTPIVTAKTSEQPLTEQVSKTTETLSTTFKSEAGEKGARADDSVGDNDDNTITVAAIGAVAAITCVVIICVFIWFVLKRRQSTGETKAYSTGMTVITNSTGPNNTLSGNAIYCEPQDQHTHFPRQLPRLGNPVYSKAIVHDNRTNSKNNTPDHEMKPYKDTNHYDNLGSVNDEHYACPDYLVKANNKTNQGSSECCYSEPEKDIYEELQDKAVRDSMYQPLIRDSRLVQESTTETPDYLTLIGDDQTNSTNNRVIPEYLTILPEPTNQSPASPDYEYATPEGQITSTLKRLQNEGPSQQNANVPSGTSTQAPVYDVLEAPDSSRRSPVYDVLEAPDDNEYLTPVDGEC